MRILLAEDDALLGDGLRAGLRQLGFQVDWVRDGAAAERELRAEPYAAAVLDLGLPRVDGLDVLAAVRRAGSKVPVLVLTARDTVPDRVRGLDLGADDYVSKPFSVRELLARVRALVRRDDWHAPGTGEFSVGDIVVRPRQRLVLRRGRRVALSAREFELLRYLFAHRNEVVSREQLLREVWGYSHLSVTRTVDNYVAKLRTHIEPRPHEPRYLITVHGSGYQLLA